MSLDSSSSSAARPSCAIMGNWRNLFDAFNTEAKPCQRANCGLCAWSRSSRSAASWSANFDVYGGYTFVAGDFCCACGCSHSCIRAGFHAVGFDEHAAGGACDGFCAGNVSYVYQRVVVAAEDVDYCPTLVAFAACWSAQNLPPPLPPLRPPLGGGRISGCFATTDNPIRSG